MKNIIGIILILVISVHVIAQNGGETITNTKKTAPEILKEVKKGKALLVDVRTPKEYDLGHLKYAINISYDTVNFKSAVKDLDKKKIFYVYSNTGKRSAKAAETLQSLGFTSYDVGGFVLLTTTGFVKAEVKKK